MSKLTSFIGGLPNDVKVHMSSGPIEKLKPYSQRAGPKPMGLWYDCEKEWMSWISSEMPNWVGAYNYVYTIHLNKSNILELKTEEDIFAFTQEYSKSSAIEPGEIDINQIRRDMGMEVTEKVYGSSDYIDWPALSSKYAGIEICPYQYGCRMDEKTRWYYTWDIASGCVWNPAGVDVRFIGLWSNEESRIIPKDELIKGNVEARRISWYKRSAL
jgi:hypothetical protein